MDINIEKASTAYRFVMANGIRGNTALVRQPWVNVVPSTPLKLEVGHSASDGGDQTEIPVATGFGKWFNLTFTVNSTACTMYINGTQVGQWTYTTATGGPPTWPATPAWRWSDAAAASLQNGIAANTQGSIKVANAYYWPSVLTTAQIAKLSIPSSPTPGVATTSYYMPEPFTNEKDFAGY
jgi:hypothetical protein